MGHMLYNPADKPFIEHIVDLFGHLTECQECRARAAGDCASQIATMFEALNGISLVDIKDGDYASAIEFCEDWLHIDTLLTLVNMVDGGEHGTVQ